MALDVWLHEWHMVIELPFCSFVCHATRLLFLSKHVSQILPPFLNLFTCIYELLVTCSMFMYIEPIKLCHKTIKFIHCITYHPHPTKPVFHWMRPHIWPCQNGLDWIYHKCVHAALLIASIMQHFNSKSVNSLFSTIFKAKVMPRFPPFVKIPASKCFGHW